MAIQDSKYAKLNSVNLSYLIFKKVIKGYEELVE